MTQDLYGKVRPFGQAADVFREYLHGPAQMLQTESGPMPSLKKINEDLEASGGSLGSITGGEAVDPVPEAAPIPTVRNVAGPIEPINQIAQAVANHLAKIGEDMSERGGVSLRVEGPFDEPPIPLISILFNGHIPVTWLGIKGDGSDEFDKMQGILSRYAGRVLLIPHGVILRVRRALTPPSNTHIVNNGGIRYIATQAPDAADGGAVIVFRSVHDCSITGCGWIDGNNVPGINGIASSGRSDLGGEARRIKIEGQTIYNCRSGHTAITELANKGGKGITLQTGPREVIVTGCWVYDCDIGISVEGSYANDGATSVNIACTYVENCRYIGLMLWGSGAPQPITGDYFQVTISGLVLTHCGMDVTVQDGFAPIVFNNAYTVTGNVMVRNPSGTHDICRGIARHADLRINADVYKVRHVFNHNDYGGYGVLASTPRQNRFHAVVTSRTAPVATGYLVDGFAITTRSHYDVTLMNVDGTEIASTQWPGRFIGNVSLNSTRLRIECQSSGKTLFDNTSNSGNRTQEPILVADDSVTSFQLRNLAGVVTVAAHGTSVGSANVTYRMLSEPYRITKEGNAIFEVRTGTVTGTTGTDGKITVAISTLGLMTVENRSGTELSFTFIEQ